MDDNDALARSYDNVLNVIVWLDMQIADASKERDKLREVARELAFECQTKNINV